jgi:carboxymethylenebutenolidase
MLVTTEFVDLPTASTPMRTLVARPAAEGTYPGVLLYTDIFQHTPSMQRAIVRFASYGFVVAAPEIYHRFEAPGRAFDFVPDYDAAQAATAKFHVTDADSDRPIVLDYLAHHTAVGSKSLHVMGFCIGGHLAFRAAALEPRVRSSVCFYPTGLESGSLGGDSGVDTLAHSSEIRGDMLIIFGAIDPHIPLEGRRKIDDTLRAAKVRYLISEYYGAHAFLRDQGERYNASEADRAVLQATAFLHSNA